MDNKTWLAAQAPEKATANDSKKLVSDDNTSGVDKNLEPPTKKQAVQDLSVKGGKAFSCIRAVGP